MRLRQFIPVLDASDVCEWVNYDERVHALWSAHRFSYPLTESDLMEKLSELLAECEQEAFIAIDDEGNKVGFACYSVTEGEGFLKHIIVSPTLRGKGNGSSMLKLILRYATEISGAESVGINVFHVNEAAIRCYERLGFVKESETKAVLTFREEQWNRIRMTFRKGE